MTEETSPQGVNPGWHLWLVGGIGILWNGFGCFDYIMTVTKNKAYLSGYPQEMLDYWFSMPWWMFGIWAVGVFGAFLGSVALLRKLKRQVSLHEKRLLQNFSETERETFLALLQKVFESAGGLIDHVPPCMYEFEINCAKRIDDLAACLDV